jgi:hypothetical protein
MAVSKETTSGCYKSEKRETNPKETFVSALNEDNIFLWLKGKN